MLAYIRKSMANRIVLLISLIFTMTIIAIGILIFRFTYQTFVDNKMTETTLRSETIAKDIKGLFEKARIVTEQLSFHPEVQAYLKTAVSRETITENPYYKTTLKTLQSTKASSDVYFLAWVANERANFYLDSEGNIPGTDYDVKKRPWYAVGMGTETSAFTAPYVEWGTGRVVISCIRPMREQGSTYGFVVMDLQLENIPSFFEAERINQTDKNFLISAEGDYVYHEEEALIMKANVNEPTDPLNPYIQDIFNSPQGLKRVLYEGKAYYLNTYQVDDNGWRVVTLIDEAAVLSEIQRIALGLTAILAAVFIFTVALIYWTVRKTMAPYQEVLHFAKDIADGEFSKNIPEEYVEREDEMGTLSRSFQTIIDAFRNENVILEQKIQEKNSELEHQYAFILEAEKAASLGHLVAGVAHEINTPVGVSMTTASYLKKINDEYRKRLAEGQMNKENLKELMGIIDESVRLLSANLERAADLVKSFKQLAVDQSSGVKSRFDLKEHVDGVVLSLLHEYKNMPVTIENKCPPGFVLYTYPGALSQVLTNLIMNSLSHGLKGRENGRITVEAAIKGKTLQIRYRDNGRGISRENMKRIYEPFFTTNRQNGNSGLGMHIVMNLMTQILRGSIHCESDLNQGVNFLLELPFELES